MEWGQICSCLHFGELVKDIYALIKNLRKDIDLEVEKNVLTYFEIIITYRKAARIEKTQPYFLNGNWKQQM